MPGKRGPNKREPVNLMSELDMRDTALFLRIPYTQFEREVNEGVWNGTFKRRGPDKWFVVHLMLDKQREQCTETMLELQTIRSIAA